MKYVNSESADSLRKNLAIDLLIDDGFLGYCAIGWVPKRSKVTWGTLMPSRVCLTPKASSQFPHSTSESPAH